MPNLAQLELAQLEKVTKKSGVGNGNRTRNRRSHSPVLCQLSYSHHRTDYSNSCPTLSEPLQDESRIDLRRFPQILFADVTNDRD